MRSQGKPRSTPVQPTQSAARPPNTKSIVTKETESRFLLQVKRLRLSVYLLSVSLVTVISTAWLLNESSATTLKKMALLYVYLA